MAGRSFSYYDRGDESLSGRGVRFRSRPGSPMADTNAGRREPSPIDTAGRDAQWGNMFQRSAYRPAPPPVLGPPMPNPDQMKTLIAPSDSFVQKAHDDAFKYHIDNGIPLPPRTPPKQAGWQMPDQQAPLEILRKYQTPGTAASFTEGTTPAYASRLASLSTPTPPVDNWDY